MKAVVWQGRKKVGVEQVPDPKIQNGDDIVIRVTSSGLCGSDLHLYNVLSPFMTAGDILGHEPMGIVEEVGPAVEALAVGDRVVVPFNISCGHCFFCERGLQSQCETTQVREQGSGAALFGYSSLYGAVAGAQAEYLRVPFANYGPVKLPDGPPEDRFLFLSDVLPTAWQAVEYAGVQPGDRVLVIGLGPIGDMCTRVAMMRGAGLVIGIDPVPARCERAQANGVTVIGPREASDDAELIERIRSLTHGRGPDSVIDAVGMEAHGAPATELMHAATGLLPKVVSRPLMKKAGIDRLSVLHLAIEAVRRGGTVSLAGVYGGMKDPMPMMRLFDKQITLRMGQANVRRWVDEILPVLSGDADPLGVERFATHDLALADAPRAYEIFNDRDLGAVKMVFRPDRLSQPTLPLAEGREGRDRPADPAA